MPKSKKQKVKRPAVVRPVVFTGPRSLLSAQTTYIQDVLSALKGNVFITGGALGVDQFVYGQLCEMFPKARQIIVIPYGYPAYIHEQLCVGALKRGHEVLDMPRYKSKSRHPNLLRNDFMCDLAMELNPEKAKLVGFPGSAIEQQRSGTWACIRSARARGLKVELHPLSDALGSSDQGVFEGIHTDPTARFKHGRIVRGDD